MFVGRMLCPQQDFHKICSVVLRHRLVSPPPTLLFQPSHLSSGELVRVMSNVYVRWPVLLYGCIKVGETRLCLVRLVHQSPAHVVNWGEAREWGIIWLAWRGTCHGPSPIYVQWITPWTASSLHVVNVEVCCVITMVTTSSLQERCSLLQSVY